MSEHTFRRSCQWPMWPHGDRPTHEYCGRKAVAGQAYCAEHAARSVRTTEEARETPRFIPGKIAA